MRSLRLRLAAGRRPGRECGTCDRRRVSGRDLRGAYPPALRQGTRRSPAATGGRGPDRCGGRRHAEARPLRSRLPAAAFGALLASHGCGAHRPQIAIALGRVPWRLLLRHGAGQPHGERGRGPSHQVLVLVERVVLLHDRRLRLAVAGDRELVDEARGDFAKVVALSLAFLGVLLALASWLQVGAGLAPLASLGIAWAGCGRGKRRTARGLVSDGAFGACGGSQRADHDPGA